MATSGHIIKVAQKLTQGSSNTSRLISPAELVAISQAPSQLRICRWNSVAWNYLYSWASSSRSYSPMMQWWPVISEIHLLCMISLTGTTNMIPLLNVAVSLFFHTSANVTSFRHGDQANSWSNCGNNYRNCRNNTSGKH